MPLPRTEITDIGRFVRAARVAHTPSGSKAISDRRRHVPYMTQNELAELVGVSTVVISQIEQGRYPNLNSSILKRIARVLELTQQQEMYVVGLLAPATDEQKFREPAPAWIKGAIADTRHPVFILNPAYDLMAWNSRGRDMFGTYADAVFAHQNALKAVFRLPEMKTFFVDWDEYAASMVSGLRMSYGVHPEYRQYVVAIAEELSREGEFFRTRWQEDDPLVIPTIEKELNHPALGLLRMIQVVTILAEAPDLTMVEFLPADDESTAKLARLK